MDRVTSSTQQRVERLLRTSRRALLAALAGLLIAAATLIAHAIRPGSFLSDWPSKAPWFIPMVIIVFGAINATLYRGGASAGEARLAMKTMLEDEFRQANLARAQRLALVVVLLGQIPLAALALSDLATAAAVTVMGVTTVALGTTTMIVSFLVFDRE